MEAAMNSLPDEILEIIFSYCTHSDLVQSIQNVCCRWRVVAQSTRVWKNITYCPKENTRSEQVVEMLEMSPNLQNIILHHICDGRVLQAITDKCVELRKLEINVLQKIDMNFIKNLGENCPNVQYLNIPHPMLTLFDKCEAVGKLTNLKVLHLTGDPLLRFLMILKPVADYCENLEHLELHSRVFKMNDLCHLLTMRKDNLHTLGVCCCNNSGECVLPALSTCELKSLSLFRYSECQRRYEKTKHFGQLKTVRALSIASFSSEDDLKQIFENENMAQLVKLSLRASYGFDNDVAEVIVRNCPLLRNLSLKYLFNMTDATFKIITNLKELNSLTIYHNLCMTDTGILPLQDVKSLKRLTIEFCNGLKNIAKLKTLQYLSLNGEDIAKFPWELVPHHMENLQCLRLHYCANVDMSAIEKLKIQLPRLKVEMSEYF